MNAPSPPDSRNEPETDSPIVSVWGGAVTRGFATIVAKALGFLSAALIVRSLALREAGVFFLAMSVAAVAGPLLAFGLPEAVSRQVARLDARGRSNEASALLRTAMTFVAGVAGVAITLAIVLPIAAGGSTSVYAAVALLSGLLAIGALVSAFMRARGRMFVAELSQAAVPIAFFSALIITFSLAKAPTGVAVLWIRTGIEAASASVMIAIAIRQVSSLGGPAGIRTMLATSLPLWIAGLAWLALQNLDVILLGVLKGPSDVAAYVPILRTADLSVVAIGLLGAYVLPAVSRLHALDRHHEIQLLYMSASKFAFAMSAPLVAALLVAPGEVANLLFHLQGGDVTTTGRILAFAYLVNALLGLNGIVIQGIGNVRGLAVRAVVVLAISAVANALLIPAFGIRGAALGTLLSYVALNTANSLALYARHRVTPWGSDMLLTVGVGTLATGLVGLSGVASRGGYQLLLSMIGIGVPTITTAWITSTRETRRSILVPFRKNSS
jgi:O-antigen/teichoic acid export membrane protein